MDSSIGIAHVLDGAVENLTRQWSITPRAASAAITEVADELHLEVGDLAALVVASHQHRPAGPRPSEPSSVGPASRLALVTDEARSTDPARSWALRGPGTIQASPVPVQPQVGALTDRESTIIALVTQGLTNREIAECTYLSINSIKSYIRAAYRKMGVERRSQAVAWGYDHGFDRAQPPVGQVSAEG